VNSKPFNERYRVVSTIMLLKSARSLKGKGKGGPQKPAF